MGATNTGGYDQALSQRLLENNTPASVLYERIRQLEKQCASLAAEIDRMQPVITMAQRWNNAEYGSNTEAMLAMRLSEVVNTYEASNPK